MKSIIIFSFFVSSLISFLISWLDISGFATDIDNSYFLHGMLGKHAITTPKLWLRYEDDAFFSCQHGLHTLEDFYEHLSSLVPFIEFIMKTVKNGVLPFFDVEVEKTTTVTKYQ